VIRVLIAATSPMARVGLESMLKRADNIEIIGSVADWDQFAAEDPDVIVADWDKSGEESLHDLLEFAPKSALVLLASDPHPSTTLEALRSGARAVLSRDSSERQIIAAIEAAAAGLAVVHPDELELYPRNRRPAALAEPLTSREIEVLGMMAEGLANKTIAHRLGISEHTVKFHVTSIMSKLNAASRTEAVTLGIRQGLIML